MNSHGLGFLKQFDNNDAKVTLYSTSRNKKTNEKKFEENHGSIFGGILSLFQRACTLSYLVYLFTNMQKGTFDNITSKYKTEDVTELLINNQFLPILSLEHGNDNLQDAI